MAEVEYRQKSQDLVDRLRANTYAFEIEGENGPEQLTVEWDNFSEFDGIQSYLLVVKNPAGEEVGTVDYKFDTKPNPPVVTVVSIDVIPRYQKKSIGQEMLRLVAKDVEEKGAKQIVAEVHIDNPAGLKVWQRVKESLTGRKYHAQHARASQSRAFNNVTLHLDQFEDEQGES